MSNTKKIKVSIVGAGNAACVTALNFYYISKYFYPDLFHKITIYYDPSIPIEKVGQGTTYNVSQLLFSCLNVHLHGENNKIKATTKDGILYENWGKKRDKIFHPFPLQNRSVHFIPNLLSKYVLECGLFEVIKKNIIDPEKEIDADYIFDCRGKNNREKNLYDKLVNPLNSVILSKKDEFDPYLTYTRCVATPNGWTFVIPNHDSVSYGYMYNDTITSFGEAKNNFEDLFDVKSSDNFSFENYIAKNIWYGERTILNGNRLCFLEPLEATSISFYLNVAEVVFNYIVNGGEKEECNQSVRNLMTKIQTFVLWHYQNGSKYETPFWNYAKSLPFYMDKEFSYYLNIANDHNFMDISYINTKLRFYADQWSPFSFKNWSDGVL